MIGTTAEAVLNAAVAYPPLERPELIEAALDLGKVCRLQAKGARILVYRDDGQVKAVATELAHAGYRRRYKSYVGSDVNDVVGQLQRAYKDS